LIVTVPLNVPVVAATEPPDKLVAVVAVAELPVQEPDEPEALPVRLAVIVPAEKLPEASLATTLEAVLAEVASTAKVPVVVIVPPVRYVPPVTEVTEPEPLLLKVVQSVEVR
jgi:hypothetical protein